MPSDRTRDNGFTLNEGRFRSGIRKKFHAIEVVSHWNSLPEKVMDAPYLELFKVRLDIEQSDLVEMMSLPMEEG